MNKWTTFVKDWASKNNMSYSSAMKNLECKEAYKATKPTETKKEIKLKIKEKKEKPAKGKLAKVMKDVEIKGGMLDKIWYSPEAMKEYATAIIKGRGDYQPKARQVIKKFGNKKIVKMYACRNPVQKLLTAALNAVSFGQFNKNWETQPYDELFHLSLRVELDTQPVSVVAIEKTDAVTLTANPPAPQKTMECEFIPLNKEITLNQLLEGGEKYMGNKYFKYSAKDNNCQDYVMGLLRGSDIGTQENYDFIKQNTKELFKGLPGTRKISNTITDLGAVANVVIQGTGAGKQKNKKGSEEAKAWGEKMKAAREAKKKLTGGMIKEPEDKATKVIAERMKKEIEAMKNLNMKQKQELDQNQLNVEPNSEPEPINLNIKKGRGVGKSKVAPAPAPAPAPTPTPAPTPAKKKAVLPVLGPNGELPVMDDKQKKSYDIVLAELMEFETIEGIKELIAADIIRSKNPEVTGWGHPHDIGQYIAMIKALHNKSGEITGRGKRPREAPKTIADTIRELDTRVNRVQEVFERYLNDEINPEEVYSFQHRLINTLEMTRNTIFKLISKLKGREPQTTQLRELEEFADIVIGDIEANLKRDDGTDTEDMSGGQIMGYGIMGGRLLPIYDLQGGKVKGFKKAMWEMQDASRKLNPLHYKDVKKAGVKTGDVTNNQLLPAVVEAGMPLLYATAGTAGMMVGGPAGSMAAIKGTQMLYDEMVTKKGYDPRERQQSEMLGTISKEVGKQGASELKSRSRTPGGSTLQGKVASKKASGAGLGGSKPQIEEMSKEDKRQIKQEYILSVRFALAQILQEDTTKLEKYDEIQRLMEDDPNTGDDALDTTIRQEADRLIISYIRINFPAGRPDDPTSVSEYPRW
jgi:hypothetical protein